MLVYQRVGPEHWDLNSQQGNRMSCVGSSNLIFAARRFRRMTVEVGSWRSGKIKPRTVQLALASVASRCFWSIVHLQWIYSPLRRSWRSQVHVHWLIWLADPCNSYLEKRNKHWWSIFLWDLSVPQLRWIRIAMSNVSNVSRRISTIHCKYLCWSQGFQKVLVFIPTKKPGWLSQK